MISKSEMPLSASERRTVMTLKDLTPKRWKKVYLHKTVESTNLLAEDLLEQKVGCGIIIAEEQTEGKGRIGRSWYSPAGKNLYISFFGPVQEGWTPQHIPQHAALAVFNTVRKFAPDTKVALKWPNDIIIGKKKVAGTLGKLLTIDGVKHYIIGVGINIETPDNHAFTYSWTPGSIDEATGKNIERKDVATTLAHELDELLSTPLAKVTELFHKEISWMINKSVSCSTDNEHYFTAIVDHFSEDAGTISLVKQYNGEPFTSHALSIRKIF